MPAAVAIPLFIAGAGAIVGAGITSINEQKKVSAAQNAADLQDQRDAIDLENLKQQTAIQQDVLASASNKEQSGINNKIGASGLEAGASDQAVSQDAFAKYATELQKLTLNLDTATKQAELNKKLHALGVQQAQDNADSAVIGSLFGGASSFLNTATNVGLFG